MTTQLAKNSRHHHAHPKLAKELVCLSSLCHLFTRTQLLTHTKLMNDYMEINIHMLKPNQTMLLLPAGKGGLECFLFFLVFTHTANTEIPNKNLYRNMEQYKGDINT